MRMRNLRQRRVPSPDYRLVCLDSPGSNKRNIATKTNASNDKKCTTKQLKKCDSFTSPSKNPFFYGGQGARVQVNKTNRSLDSKQHELQGSFQTKSLKSKSGSTKARDKKDSRKGSTKDNEGGFSGKLISQADNGDSSNSDNEKALHDADTKLVSSGKSKPELLSESVNLKKPIRPKENQITKKQPSKCSNSQKQHPYRRPKRNIVPKKETAYGLLWQEEAALQRALNASIQAQRHKDMPAAAASRQMPFSQSTDQHCEILLSESKSSISRLSSCVDSDREDFAKEPTGKAEPLDDNYYDILSFAASVTNETPDRSDKRMRVRAQRKFASSSAQLEMLNMTPNKLITFSQPTKFVKTNGKTEDFLTFLCLRNSPLLPSYMDCFKFNSECDSLASFPSSPQGSYGGSYPGTPASLPVPSDCGNHELVDFAGASSYSPTIAHRPKPSRKKSNPLVRSLSFKSQLYNSSKSHSTYTKRMIDSWRRTASSPRQRSKVSTNGSCSVSCSPFSSIRKNIFSSGYGQGLRSRSRLSFTPTGSKKSQMASSNVKSGVAKTESEMSSSSSLKSRLRASTKALSAAVIKEQLLNAKHMYHRKYTARAGDEEEEGQMHEDSLQMTYSHFSHANARAYFRQEESRNVFYRTLIAPETKSEVSRSTSLDNSSTAKAMQQSRKATSFMTEMEGIAESPAFHPSAEQLQCFPDYVTECSSSVEPFGSICRIIPPDGWKMDCNISPELRFAPQTQYVHKMTNRWGPNVQQLACITNHIESQGGSLDHIPLVGGVETDMVALSEAVLSCGGIQQVIDKNKWAKVAEMLRIPNVAKEKTSRLYEIYCRYLLSYDMLSVAEKRKLEDKLLSKKERDPSYYDQPCTVKSRTKTLSEFFCVARNTQSIYFENDPSPCDVQREFWQIADERKSHVAVQTGHLDSWLYGGMKSRTGAGSNRGKDVINSEHKHNLKTLVQNNQSILSHLQQISGVTEPVLDISMLFSTLCWSRDHHLLPRVYYLHTGADVVWYAVPASEENQLKELMQQLTPELINSDLSTWLPDDSVMISPIVLKQNGIQVCKTIQQQGQFIIIFPDAFAANISCGYNIMEHINFTYTPKWLPLGQKAAQMLVESCEPESFSMDQLLVDLVSDEETSTDILRIVLPFLEDVVQKELTFRKQLTELGLKSRQQNMSPKESSDTKTEVRQKSSNNDSADCDIPRCEISEKLCFLSVVLDEQNEVVYSVAQALTKLQRRKNLSSFVLLYRFDELQLNEIIEKGQLRISGRRRSPSKRNAASARYKTRS